MDKKTKSQQMRPTTKMSAKSRTNMKIAATLISKPQIMLPEAPPVEKMTSREFQLDLNAHIDVAAQMLKDENSIRNFQLAINLNKHLFRGKTVLNIGCGCGILSLFVAKAGADRIFAIDPSNVVDYTRAIVAANNYAHVIEVIKGRIEDICLPVEQVDIIICDWMGYSLLYQSTCEAVIYARDKWLRRDAAGLIFPDEAKLFIAGFEDAERKNEKIEWWKNVYGFNMKSMREFALREPCFYAIQPHQLVTSDFNVKTLDLYKVTKKDLGFRTLYALRALRSCLMDGVVSYFQVRFSKSHTPFVFGTDPWSPNTHWMQTVFFFDQAVAIHTDEIISGGFEMVPDDSKEPCLNNIEVSLELCCSEPIQLLVEMRWQMKPHATSATNAGGPLAASPLPKNVVGVCSDNKKVAKKATEKMSPFFAPLIRRSDNKKNIGLRRNHKSDFKKELIYTY